MEEHAVVARLHVTRSRLRTLLVPDPATGRIEADEFPRSAVMRLLSDQRARRTAFTALSMLLMVAGRRSAGVAGLLPRISQSLGALKGLQRH